MIEIDAALLSFPERLHEVVADTPVSAFARKCDMNESILRAYLRGSSYPGLEKLLMLAINGGVTVEWLATGREPKFDDGGTRLTLAQGQAGYNLDFAQEFVRVPHYDVRASAGLGRESDQDLVTHYNCYRKDWWQQHIGVNYERCFTLDLQGDSMAPVLTDQDRPIIDRGDNEVLSDAIYVFRLAGQVFIKYLERSPTRGLVVRSENSRYHSWEIGDDSRQDEFEIIGRAIYKESGERL